MKVLVTGVAGFIGSNYVKYHLSTYSDDFIVGLDALTYAGSIENLDLLSNEEAKRFKFIKGNILNEELVEYFHPRYREIVNPRLLLRQNKDFSITMPDADGRLFFTWLTEDINI